MSSKMRLAAAGAVAAVTVTTAPALAAQGTGGHAPALASAVPHWATPSALRGVVPAGRQVAVDVLLRYRDARGLAAYDRVVADPASPTYGHYLTTRQFNQRFAPTPAAVARVTSWLRAVGVHVDHVSSSRVLVQAHGTAARVESAFGTVLGRYAYRGKLLQAPEIQPSLPARLLPDVAAVVGLADTEALLHPNITTGGPDASPAPAFVNARPCGSYYGQTTATSVPKAYGHTHSYVPCGYTPAQIRHAYGLDKVRSTGAGQTVVIVDAFASPTLEQDVNTYSARHGLPTLKPGQLTQYLYPAATSTPEQPAGPALIDPQGWSGEQTLDFEAAHTMAPGAKLAYVAATDPVRGLEVADLQAVENSYGHIISNSWGSGDDYPTPDEQALVDATTAQAVAKGIGLYFSSGDDLDEVSADGFRSADFPATSPQVTAVGGTTLMLGKRSAYKQEIGWGETTATLTKGSWGKLPGTYDGGGGGGVSATYAEPSYQQGVVPTKLATDPASRQDMLGLPESGPGRVVPDISLVGDPNTGFLMGQTQTFPNGSVRYSEYRIGGTSVSAPLFAGVMAVADQVAGHPHGFVNPALYAAYRAHRSIVRDVTDHGTPAQVRVDYTNEVDATKGYTTFLRTAGEIGTLHLLKGYDDSTGLGTPWTPALVAALK